METNLNMNKLYRDALKRNFNGSFKQFSEMYNKYQSELLSKEDLDKSDKVLNDRGPAVAVADSGAVAEPVIKEAAAQEAIIRSLPVAEEAPASKPAPTKADDDTIMGMNKWLFFILLIAGVIAIGTASIMIYNAYYKKAVLPAPAGGPATDGQAQAQVK